MGEHLPITIPDRDYWKDQINCQAACPVHTDARGYVRAIAAGDFERAYLIARGPNPMASVCGRVCGAPWGVAAFALDVAKGYLPVLIAQRSLFEAETQLLVVRREFVSDRISLLRALGGKVSEEDMGAMAAFFVGRPGKK